MPMPPPSKPIVVCTARAPVVTATRLRWRDDRAVLVDALDLRPLCASAAQLRVRQVHHRAVDQLESRRRSDAAEAPAVGRIDARLDDHDDARGAGHAVGLAAERAIELVAFALARCGLAW